MTDIQDKDGRAIRRGDQVYTPIRGGKHEGMVDKIVTSENDAAEEGVKRPPKVRCRTSHSRAYFRQYHAAWRRLRNNGTGLVHQPARKGGRA